MEAIQYFLPLFIILISFCAIFTALGLLFNILLNPVKENQARMEREIISIKEKLDKEIVSIKEKLDKEIVSIKEKLDRVLMQKS